MYKANIQIKIFNFLIISIKYFFTGLIKFNMICLRPDAFRCVPGYTIAALWPVAAHFRIAGKAICSYGILLLPE